MTRPGSILKTLAGWRASRRRAARHMEFALLSDCTLRDLGVCRAEYLSFEAEAASDDMPTRRRVAWQVAERSAAQRAR